MDVSQNYQLHYTFGGHLREINSVQFSHDGIYLASGADDGYVFIWSTTDGEKVQKLSPKQGPIVIVKWFNCAHLPQCYFLISGGADGTVKMWGKTEKQIHFDFIGMCRVAENPIEDADYDETRLAVVGGGRLFILSIDVNHSDVFQPLLVEPESLDPPIPALARAVHFFNTGKCIMVAFLDAKEIIAWNISPWSRLWKQTIPTRIGNTAWSNTSQKLLIWNLTDGIDVYNVSDRPVWVTKLRIPIQRNFPVQVTFGAWNTVISGSDSGEIYIWDLINAKPIRILIHSPGVRAIQTVSYSSPQHNRHLLASASSDPGSTHPTIKVWSNLPNSNTSIWWPPPAHATSLLTGASLMILLVAFLAWISQHFQNLTILVQKMQL